MKETCATRHLTRPRWWCNERYVFQPEVSCVRRSVLSGSNGDLSTTETTEIAETKDNVIVHW